MKITVDGIEYEVDNADFVKLYKDTAKELTGLKSDNAVELKTATDKLSTVQAKHDQLTEDKATLEKEVVELKKVDMGKAVNEAVKEKLDLMIVAEKMDVEIKEDMSTMDIKKAVVLKKYPEAKLDEKEDVYINARFDGVVEGLSETSGNTAFKGDSLKDKKTKTPEDKADDRDSEEARKDMIKNMADRSKRKED